MSVHAFVWSVSLERIISSFFCRKNSLTRSMMYSPRPDRSILFLLDQYVPQSCSHCGCCSISVILRSTTHKCSEEVPITVHSRWLVIAVHNYWRRGMQHNPRDGTKKEWPFHHEILNKIWYYSISWPFK